MLSNSKHLILLIFSLSACGELTEEDRNLRAPISRLPILSSNPPASYKLFDRDCQTDDAPVALSATSIWGWEGLSIVDTRTDLEESRTAKTLESSIVAKTEYGRVYERNCVFPGDSRTPVCGYDAKLGYRSRSAKRGLRICRDNFSYPREVYEGVGLTGLHYLNEAAEFYRTASNDRISKVTLSVLPHFTTYVRSTPNRQGEPVNLQFWITNNLAYFPGNNMIAIFPESEKTASSGNHQGHLWESAFVLKHEFGHHIEYELVGKKLRGHGFHWDATAHSYQYRPVNAEDISYESQQKRLKFWGAISEAFADLMGFYAENGDAASLKNIPCFGRNRDVGNKLFADNTTSKLLTSSVVDTFLKPKRRSAYCGEANFTDPHIVGAVVARGVDQIWQLLLDEIDDRSLDTVGYARQRYKLSLLWLSEVYNADYAARGRSFDSRDMFAPLGAAVEQVVRGYVQKVPEGARSTIDRSSLNLMVCKRFAELYPTVEPPPFSTKGKCE